LERWFGGVPGLWLAAEHGAVVRDPSAGAAARWQERGHVSRPDWKNGVRAILDHFVDRTPGSFVEEKAFALVWHYRMVHPEFGDWIANELVSTLEPALADTELVAQRGNKIVEAKLTWANKGEVLAWLHENACPQPDFVLFAGDDRTDEDLFARMPSPAWTIHVGEGPSGARFRVADPGRVAELIARLAADATGTGTGTAAGARQG
jgi:trehalose 6-phosphate synthase/phosphatase